MTKDSVSEYDTDPNNNTDVGGIAIEGSDNVQNFDNALRQIMAHAKDEHNSISELFGQSKIINGGFDVNQEGVSGTVTLSAGDYGHDMWKAGSSGCTYTFSTLATGSPVVIVITSGTLLQVVKNENVSGGTHCLSWSGTAQARINTGSYGGTGISAIAGQNGDDINIEFGTGSVYNVSLVEGDIPASYKRRFRQTEIMLCEFYYEKQVLLKTLQTGIYNDELWRTRKYTTPTLTISGATVDTQYVDKEGWNVTVSSPTNVFITAIADCRP